MTNTVVVPGLRFLRTPAGARFGHTLSFERSGVTVCELVSVESDSAGAASNAWPPSPPLQDWQYEERAGGGVFLAVGKAGRSHWSAAIELRADGTTRFDVAVRAAEPPQFVGSQYLTSGACVVDGQDACIFGRSPGTTADGWRLLCDPETTRLRVVEQNQRIIIEPQSVDATGWPQTIRWCYSLAPIGGT